MQSVATAPGRAPVQAFRLALMPPPLRQGNLLLDVPIEQTRFKLFPIAGCHRVF